MKRLLCILLILLLVGSLVGCMGFELDLDGGNADIDIPIFTQGDSRAATKEAEPAGDTEEAPEPPTEEPVEAPTEPGITVTEDGVYDSKEEVALYIHLYGHLPSNYITKKEAEALGWPGGDLRPYAPGKCIGGSHFGNYEGLLPDAKGRTWTECDIDTMNAKSRGAKRIIFSNDGLIYYTDDHYESFELLYGEGD